MPDRLEIHTATIAFDVDGDDEEISVGGYVVFDSVACIVRHASLQFRWCQQWIDNHGHEYPEPEDDDLS